MGITLLVPIEIAIEAMTAVIAWRARRAKKEI